MSKKDYREPQENHLINQENEWTKKEEKLNKHKFDYEVQFITRTDIALQLDNESDNDK